MGPELQLIHSNAKLKRRSPLSFVIRHSSFVILPFLASLAAPAASKLADLKVAPPEPPLSFRLDVMPVLMKAGCNAGACTCGSGGECQAGWRCCGGVCGPPEAAGFQT